jgi:hypothetical protein
MSIREILLLQIMVAIFAINAYVLISLSYMPHSEWYTGQEAVCGVVMVVDFIAGLVFLHDHNVL